FELQGEVLPAHRQDPSRGPRQPGTPPTRANGHRKSLGLNERDNPRANDHETLSTSLHPPLASWSNSRTIAPGEALGFRERWDHEADSRQSESGKRGRKGYAVQIVFPLQRGYPGGSGCRPGEAGCGPYWQNGIDPHRG